MKRFKVEYNVPGLSNARAMAIYADSKEEALSIAKNNLQLDAYDAVECEGTFKKIIVKRG